MIELNYKNKVMKQSFKLVEKEEGVLIERHAIFNDGWEQKVSEQTCLTMDDVRQMITDRMASIGAVRNWSV